MIIIIFASSCNSEEIEGIWIQSHTIKGGSKFFSPGTTLFDFEDKKLNIVKIGNLETGQFDTVLINTAIFDLQNSRLLLEKDGRIIKLQIQHLSKDSLLFIIPEIDEDEIIVFKPLNQSKGTPISPNDLVGKAFRIPGEDFISQLEFLNDSVVFDSGYNSIHSWTISNYKNYQFLNTSIWLGSKIPLSKEDRRLLAITNKGQNTSEIIPVEPLRSKGEIQGRWIEEERSIHPPLYILKDTLQSLSIENDSIKIKRFNRSKSYFYRLSVDGSTIFFPNNRWSTDKNPSIKPPLFIHTCSTNELVLLEKRSFGDSTIVKYKSW